MKDTRGGRPPHSIFERKEIMRRSRTTLFVLALILMAGLIMSCGKKEEPTPAAETEAPSETAAPSAAAPVDLAGGATVSGKILFAGSKPKPMPLRMDAEPACKDAHAGGVFAQEVVVNDNGTLQYVMVYVKEGLGEKSFQPIEKNVVLDQKGCLYDPHVFGVVAGQEFEIANSDPTTHNVHPIPKTNREWNQSQPPKGERLKKSFSRPEVAIPVKCNVHPWMKSYIGVFKHPFFSVSGKDGTFQIKGLPPGNYTIEAWHEKFGVQEQKVSVSAKESKTVDFTFKG